MRWACTAWAHLLWSVSARCAIQRVDGANFSGMALSQPGVAHWIELPLLKDNRVITLKYRKDQDWSKLAEEFILEHKFMEGIHPATTTSTPEVSRPSAPGLLVYDMRVHAMGREFDSGVQNLYYPVQRYFAGEIHKFPGFQEMFLDMVEKMGGMGREDVLRGAYRYLREEAMGKGIAEAAYTLANMLVTLRRMGRVGEAYVEEAREVLRQALGLNESLWTMPAGACTRPPTPEKGGEGHMRVVTVASDARPELSALLDSARAVGVEVSVLGLHAHWRGLGSKLRRLHEYLHQQPPSADHDLLLFVDAFDVSFTPSAGELVARYRALEGPIIFGAEASAAPDVAMTLLYEPYHQAIHTPPSTPLRYLNSGTYMGPLGLVRAMVDEVLQDLGQCYQLPEAREHVDDQRWFTRYLLRHPELARLDTGGQLFHTLHGMDPQLFEVSEQGEVRSQVTGTAPCIIHGNGNGCRLYKELVKGMIKQGWPAQTALTPAQVTGFFPRFCPG